MKKKFYSVLTLSLALQTVLAPTYSFAESAEKSAEVYTEDQILKVLRSMLMSIVLMKKISRLLANSYYTLQKTFIIYRE